MQSGRWDRRGEIGQAGGGGTDRKGVHGVVWEEEDRHEETREGDAAADEHDVVDPSSIPDVREDVRCERGAQLAGRGRDAMAGRAHLRHGGTGYEGVFGGRHHIEA